MFRGSSLSSSSPPPPLPSFRCFEHTVYGYFRSDRNPEPDRCRSIFPVGRLSFIALLFVLGASLLILALYFPSFHGYFGFIPSPPRYSLRTYTFIVPFLRIPVFVVVNIGFGHRSIIVSLLFLFFSFFWKHAMYY
ncbi:hypothetical protein BDQ17DRAFT_970642 [Cyathus striatus]|nr:hypothetical protein BDQ17DRAFT_970642 [Cyathus striatus]